MLAKTERLTRADFTQYFKSGTRTQSQYLTVVYTPSKYRHGSVVVGKKVAKQAVARNALRRQVYATLRRCTENIPGVYIVIVKPAAAQLTRVMLRDEVAAVIVRAVKTK